MDRAGRSRHSHAVVLALLSIAAVSGAWCRPREQSVTIVGVVIISLDTTRADRLPVYGFMDAAMPHLDRLAREGVVFDQATSVAHWRVRRIGRARC